MEAAGGKLVRNTDYTTTYYEVLLRSNDVIVTPDHINTSGISSSPVALVATIVARLLYDSLVSCQN